MKSLLPNLQKIIRTLGVDILEMLKFEKNKKNFWSHI